MNSSILKFVVNLRVIACVSAPELVEHSPRPCEDSSGNQRLFLEESHPIPSPVENSGGSSCGECSTDEPPSPALGMVDPELIRISIQNNIGLNLSDLLLTQFVGELKLVLHELV